MKHDLKSMTRKELVKLSTDIDKALERVEAKEKKLALAAAEKAVKALGFTLSEVAGTAAPAKPARKTPKKAKAASKPKYANPDDKTQTWTGKGRRPVWFVKATEAGVSTDALAI